MRTCPAAAAPLRRNPLPAGLLGHRLSRRHAAAADPAPIGARHGHAAKPRRLDPGGGNAGIAPATGAHPVAGALAQEGAARRHHAGHRAAARSATACGAAPLVAQGGRARKDTDLSPLPSSELPTDSAGGRTESARGALAQAAGTAPFHRRCRPSIENAAGGDANPGGTGPASSIRRPCGSNWTNWLAGHAMACSNCCNWRGWSPTTARRSP